MATLEHLIDAVPVAPLRICALPGCEHMAYILNEHIKEFRKELLEKHPEKKRYYGYNSSSFLLDSECPRFGTGEAKGVLNESVRGADLYLLVDITNNTVTYRMRGFRNYMSPDDHFQNLKRIISASTGKAHRINVIMPFLYESRQHKRSSRESLDNAMALQELASMGVSNIITFDAHDPRTQNAIPLCGFENYYATYQFVKALYNNLSEMMKDPSELMIISPDEGALFRAKYLATVLGADLGMFYKRRDYSVIENGKNPIVAHEFLGSSLEGKNTVVMDDMIASGDSMLHVAKLIKERGAKSVTICTTFGLFTAGLDLFDQYYEDGYFEKIITTNLVYQSPELLKKPWYATANTNRYLANIIFTLNHDVNTQEVSTSTEKITALMSRTSR